MARPHFTPQQVIERGRKIKARSNEYSQPLRGNTMNDHYYDCSSFQAVINGIGNSSEDGPFEIPSTPEMVSYYTAQGYKHITDFSDYSEFKKGDVLVHNGAKGGSGNDGHTVLYIGNGNVIECTGGGVRQGGIRSVVEYWHGEGIGRASSGILRNTRSGLYPIKWEGN